VILFHSRLWFVLVASTGLVACSGGTGDPDVQPTDDVQTDGNTQDVGTDVPRDTGRPITPYSFGPCPTASGLSCPAGTMCLDAATSGYAGGICTHTCTADTDCRGVGGGTRPGLCATIGTAQYCVRDCTDRTMATPQPGIGETCERDDAICRNVVRSGTYRGECTPSCGVMGGPACDTGTRCNAWTGRCEPMSAPNPPPGAENGDACMRDGDCRSGNRCIPEFLTGTPQHLCATGNTRTCNTDTECGGAAGSCINRYFTFGTPGLPTGWVGGFCMSSCSLPVGFNSSTFWSMARLPQSNCPTASICVPYLGQAARDEGLCRFECTADTNCRPGYVCNRQFGTSTGTRTFPNGYCAPMNCLQTGRTCPAGYACERRAVATNTSNPPNFTGVCVPSQPPGDGGVDGGDAMTPTDVGPGEAGSSDGGLDVSTD
jgi:hypothetical protein